MPGAVPRNWKTAVCIITYDGFTWSMNFILGNRIPFQEVWCVVQEFPVTICKSEFESCTYNYCVTYAGAVRSHTCARFAFPQKYSLCKCCSQRLALCQRCLIRGVLTNHGGDHVRAVCVATTLPFLHPCTISPAPGAEETDFLSGQ